MTGRIRNLARRWVHRQVKRLAPLINAEIELVRRAGHASKAQDQMHYMQSCGNGVQADGPLDVSDLRSVAIGHGVRIGKGAVFASAGGVTIGDFTEIGRDVTIDTESWNPQCRYQAAGVVAPQPVLIGRHVKIGMGSTIRAGVCIGDGAVVPAGGVVGEEIQAVTRGAERSASDAVWPDGSEAGLVHGEDPRCRLFFVLTTGRSGSMTIAKVLSQHTQISCRHEPRPQLIRLATELAHRTKGVEDVVRELREIYARCGVFPADKVYGESDQKLWNLFPLLAEMFPRAKFVWLIRDGRDVVASISGRAWFSSAEVPGEAASPNLGLRSIIYRENAAACGAVDERRWADMTAFGKGCWYWSHLNTQIERQLSRLTADRWLQVRLEELGLHMGDVFRFLGLRPESVQVESHNRAQYEVKDWRKWSTAERSVFEAWCGDGMDRWYAGWRASRCRADSGTELAVTDDCGDHRHR